MLVGAALGSESIVQQLTHKDQLSPSKDSQPSRQVLRVPVEGTPASRDSPPLHDLTLCAGECVSWANCLLDPSALMQLTVYSVLLALGLYALHDQPWTYNSSALWEGWPTQSIP